MGSVDDDGGVERTSELKALHLLKSSDPPLFLTPSPELSKAARLASEYLFASLNPYAPNSPFAHLLTEGFDAEQIWHQIDLQALPLLSSIRRQLRTFENQLINFDQDSGKGREIELINDDGVESEDLDDVIYDDEEENDDEDMENHEEDKKKIKRKRDESSDEDEDEDDELGFMGLEDDDDDDLSKSARYEDFFTCNVRSEYDDESDGMDMDDQLDHDDEDDNQNEQSLPIHDELELKPKQSLSSHEKEIEKLGAEIEEMERANMEPKAWTMLGEVTAADRSRNSALEVDIDFEHNVIPAPLQTLETNASLEEIIKTRIVEGQFDDFQKPPASLNKAPEIKELDDNKSKKGLAQLYEEEFAQKTGLVSAALSFSDEQKKQASMLFKKLCVKLDALSHFHFAPKPVIEDMSIQPNVPALAMEEAGPHAVSNGASKAPEEVFSGEGDIKEEAELTKADRKRRRANKKKQFKKARLGAPRRKSR